MLVMCYILMFSFTLFGYLYIDFKKMSLLHKVNSLLDLGGEPDLSDFVQLNESSSSFSVLFMEQEKMRVSARKENVFASIPLL